jgi:hypothetical protein
MTLGQIGSERSQHFIESEVFRGQTPGQGSLTHSKLASDFADLRLAMRQEHRDRILNFNSEWISIGRAVR